MISTEPETVGRRQPPPSSAFRVIDGAQPGTGDGSAIEVAPGVFWLRMPIHLIPHINIWLLAEEDGWTAVDTGTYHPDAVAAWERVSDKVLRGLPLRRVIATHFHPDHCGMAGWLAERFGATLWMTRLEYQAALLSQTEHTGAPPAQWLEFYAGCGWGEADLAHYRDEFGLYERITAPLPAQFHRLTDGDIIPIGGRSWEIVGGAGHSPEHAALFCADLKLLISGDQVLPKISSNIAVLPREPGANPLHDWLTSLQLIADRVPQDTIALPAHGPLFTGVPDRIAALIAGHRDRLDALQTAITQAPGQSAVDLFPVLYRRAIDSRNIRMATGEMVAHLNYLAAQKQVRHVAHEDHVVRWYPVC